MKNKQPMKQVTILVKLDDWKAIVEIAKREDRPVGAQMRLWITQALRSHTTQNVVFDEEMLNTDAYKRADN